MKRVALILCLVPVVMCGVRPRTPAVKESSNERRNLNFTSGTPKHQENMQKYITHLHRQEPSDSHTMSKYIKSYDEQPQTNEETLSDRVAVKNHEEFPFHKSDESGHPKLPSPVHVIKFELADAAVPNKETEELISLGRARSLKPQTEVPPTQPSDAKPTSKPKISNSNRPQRTHRRKSTPRPSTASGDMATQESRMVQIIHPIPFKKDNHLQTSESRHVKSLHAFPSDVQDIIKVVLQKDAQQYTPNGLYKDQYTDAQRYGYHKNIASLPKDFNHQQFWKQQLLKSSKNRLILRPVTGIYYPNQYSQGHNIFPPLKQDSYTPAEPSHQTLLQPDANHIPTNFKIEVPDEPVQHDETPYKLYNSAYTSVELTNDYPYSDDLNSLQPRPQDSRAPILFPPGARQTLPKSNTTVAILNKYHQQAGPVPLEPTEYYYPPSVYKPIVNEIKPYHTKPILFQSSQPNPLVTFYYPKDHTPITETPSEGEPHKTEVVLYAKPPAPVEAPVYKPVHYPNHVAPTSYTHFQSGHGREQNLHQYASGYAFGYRVRDFHTGNDFGHTQNRDPDGVTRGEYHILLPDGRLQSVKYTADDQGFHADVSYNEHSGAGGGGADAAAAPAKPSAGLGAYDAAGSASSVRLFASTVPASGAVNNAAMSV